LGISPKSGDIGYFVGAGIHAENLFVFGAGVAFQQETELSPGLTVGQAIASADALKTERHFHAGPYLFISVSLPK
jgi:hypothetical protein